MGHKPDGVTPLGNEWIGVAMGTCGGRDNLVQGNTIAFNGSAFPNSAGVQVDSAVNSCVK